MKRLAMEIAEGEVWREFVEERERRHGWRSAGWPGLWREKRGAKQ